jgi:hypothetical protein
MIAAIGRASSGAKAHELPLPGLQQSPSQRSPGHIEIADDIAVQLDPALGDQTARLARRRYAKQLDEQSREVHGVVRWDIRFRNLLGGLALAHDAGEMGLRAPSGLFPM